MKRIKASYQDGVFRPLEPVGIPDHGEVEISIHAREPDGTPDAVQAAQRVFDGLADPEIEEILRVALGRSGFSRHGP